MFHTATGLVERLLIQLLSKLLPNPYLVRTRMLIIHTSEDYPHL